MVNRAGSLDKLIRATTVTMTAWYIGHAVRLETHHCSKDSKTQETKLDQIICCNIKKKYSHVKIEYNYKTAADALRK